MENTSISDVRRMCQRGAFRAYVQGGKVFLEDTATGQVVPLDGESGPANTERRAVPRREDRRGSRVERMFGARDTWKSADPDADQGPYRSFLIVQCEECGAIKAFCAKHETFGYKCSECGHETPLEKLRPLFMHCKCGKSFSYKTNLTADRVTHTWKAADKWEEALPKKKRGGQPGNQNSKGKRNAAGSHDGAPPGNKNAEKDGAYSTVFFDMLSAEELKIAESAPMGGREALEHEMKILKFREHKILAKIAEYESQPEDALFVSSLLDMRTPGGRGKDKKDGANQTMGMYSKDSAFSRVLKLQEALYKVQGRIAKIADSLRALEESDRRMALEKQRLEILRMRATGAVDVPDPDGTAADDLDAPLEEDTEE